MNKSRFELDCLNILISLLDLAAASFLYANFGQREHLKAVYEIKWNYLLQGFCFLRPKGN